MLEPETQLKEKQISHHPLERYVKDIYAYKIKFSHNSVNNPQFPKNTERNLPSKRLKLTVIGVRITKQFIHCMHLVKGLYKYKPKYFAAPVIRGVTAIEWPNIWTELKARYGGLAYCLQNPVAVLLDDKLLGGDKELIHLVQSKYVYHLNLDYYKLSVEQFSTFVKSSARPCAYMHISVDDKMVGTFIFSLYSDLVPLTCENFLRLCRETRGGYSGTPVHRIVKHGWIQCGGYALKTTDLDCENFIIPHDRRGVLCMANDGRHVDCSTQFFILLQPAPWMAHKYVAFGQLIEGEKTLQLIESVPTYYESPQNKIIIAKAGILNLDCHDITINKGTNEFIQGHIEDLIALGELLIDVLMQQVILEIEIKDAAQHETRGAQSATGDLSIKSTDIHATRRFMRKKSDIQKQIKDSEMNSVHEEDNNDFDVEEYIYEPEEYQYQHASPPSSIVVKPQKPYYIPLTDVPYPEEADSTYDLKKFLKGDYCLESDIKPNQPEKVISIKRSSFNSEIFDVPESRQGSVDSLDSDDEKEIRRYLKFHSDRVSFAGGIIKNIAKNVAKINIFDDARRSELITDETLRKLRIASISDHSTKKVLIAGPEEDKEIRQIKRRQTGFVRPIELEKVHRINSNDRESNRKVRIADSALEEEHRSRAARRPTGYVRLQPAAATAAADSDDSDDDEEHLSTTRLATGSAMKRLMDRVTTGHSLDDYGPTLKDYKPLSEIHQRNIMLTHTTALKSDEDSPHKFIRHSANDNESYEQFFSLQHGKKFGRKISSDYVTTIDQIKQKAENSLRSVEFAKTRPSLSVSEYQKKNNTCQETNQIVSRHNNIAESTSTGVRLPGDTPLYSLSSTDDI